MIDVQPGLWRAFKELAHFMALDASRPWARGILFRGQTAMATNNIVIAEKWLDKTILPYELNIPQESVDELIRISEDPKKIRTNGRSITFYFNQDRWMRTQLLSTAWPDTSKVWRDDKADPVPDGFFEALESLEPFIDDLKRIYITPGRISTSPLEEDGASFEIPELNTTGIFSLPQLMLLKGVAKTLGLDGYPKPCVFYGKQLRGIIVGMRG
jgi:hypothetical protein